MRDDDENEDLRDRLSMALWPWEKRISGFPTHDVITDVLAVLKGEMACPYVRRADDGTAYCSLNSPT